MLRLQGIIDGVEILVGSTMAALVIAAFVFAVAYGPRSSDIRDKTEAAAWPQVQTAWIVPTPKGYDADSTEAGAAPTGIETLKDVAGSGPENGNTEALRRAGWRSGVAEYWIQPSQLQDPSTINLNIDQFASTADAAAYQAKTVSYTNKTLSALYTRTLLQSSLRGIPGVVAEQLTVGHVPSAAGALIVYHRGPYVVTFLAFKAPITGLVKSLAQAQFSRLPSSSESSGTSIVRSYASSPHVSMAWAVPTPVGYVALKGGGPPPSLFGSPDPEKRRMA